MESNLKRSTKLKFLIAYDYSQTKFGIQDIMQNKKTYDASREAASFISLKDEKLFFATRRHVSVVFFKLGITTFCAFASVAIFVFFEKNMPIVRLPLVFSEAIFLLFLMSVSVKIIVDWFFYIYIVTSRKVLEVCYRPFFSEDINVVPLDQVRCVEIHVVSRGFMNMILDVGNILLEFDLFTHKDTFVLANISAPQEIGIMLAEKLNQIIADHVDNLSVLPPQGFSEGQENTKNDGVQKFPHAIFSRQILRGGGEKI